LLRTRLKQSEKRLPFYLQEKILRSRRREIDRLGIKRIIETEGFIRIKYIRYEDIFLIGIRGSLDLSKRILKIIRSFLKTNLHLTIDLTNTKITNSYSGKIYFLGIIIYNKEIASTSFINSRAIESRKRAARRVRLKKNLAKKKLIRNTRKYIIDALDLGQKKISDNMFLIKNLNYRIKLKTMSEILSLDALKGITLPEVFPDDNSLYDETLYLRLNKKEIMHKINQVLLKNNAITEELTQ